MSMGLEGGVGESLKGKKEKNPHIMIRCFVGRIITF